MAGRPGRPGADHEQPCGKPACGGQSYRKQGDYLCAASAAAFELARRLLPISNSLAQLQHFAFSMEELNHDDFFWTILETMTAHTGRAEDSSAVHGFGTWTS